DQGTQVVGRAREQVLAGVAREGGFPETIVPLAEGHEQEGSARQALGLRRGQAAQTPGEILAQLRKAASRVAGEQPEEPAVQRGDVLEVGGARSLEVHRWLRFRQSVGDLSAIRPVTIFSIAQPSLIL